MMLKGLITKKMGFGGSSSGTSLFTLRNVATVTVVGLLIYWLYTKLFKPKTLDLVYNAQVLTNSTELMSNGTSYYQFARTLATELHETGFWGMSGLFTFKNSDEAMLGGLLLIVKTHEFSRLNDVYVAFKANNTMGKGSLESDLRRTFNADELKKYMSHLITL